MVARHFAWRVAEVVSLLLQSVGIDTNQAMSDNQTPALVASQEGHADVLKLLIAAGADLSVRVVDPSPIDSEVSGLTPLGIAQKKGHSVIVSLLLVHGVGNH